MVVAPGESTFSVPVARAVEALSFSTEQEDKIHKLLDKNNAGSISARELAELEGYIRVGNFLNLLKTKARSSLARKMVKR